MLLTTVQWYEHKLTKQCRQHHYPPEGTYPGKVEKPKKLLQVSLALLFGWGYLYWCSDIPSRLSTNITKSVTFWGYLKQQSEITLEVHYKYQRTITPEKGVFPGEAIYLATFTNKCNKQQNSPEGTYPSTVHALWFRRSGDMRCCARLRLAGNCRVDPSIPTPAVGPPTTPSASPRRAAPACLPAPCKKNTILITVSIHGKSDDDEMLTPRTVWLLLHHFKWYLLRAIHLNNQQNK